MMRFTATVTNKRPAQLRLRSKIRSHGLTPMIVEYGDDGDTEVQCLAPDDTAADLYIYATYNLGVHVHLVPVDADGRDL